MQSSRTVGLDESTPLGTARQIFDSASAPETAALTLYASDGTSRSGSTLTLSVSGCPGKATYSWYPKFENTPAFPGGACAARLDVEGAVLRFKTADSAFDESISGTVSSWPLSSAGQLSFNASSTADFQGTYDGSWIPQKFKSSALWLYTSFWPARGWLAAKGVANLPDANVNTGLIAGWTGTLTEPRRGADACSDASDAGAESDAGR